MLGYFLGHWLGNLIASGYQQVQNSGQNDFAIILGYVLGTIGWLAGLGVFNDLLRQMTGRPVHADAEAQAAVAGTGPVLPVLAGPQGRRHPVPVRHDRLLPDRRPAGHGDPDRTAVALLPRLQLRDLHRDRRRARHDDDDDDEFGHPRAARQLPGAADDRLQADGVPADRGAVLLADPGGLPRAAVRPDVRRVPVRLDRLRSRCRSRPPRERTLRGRVRDHGDLADPARLQPHRHDRLLPGPRDALEPAADLRLGEPDDRVPDAAGRAGPGRRDVHDDHRPHGADRVLHRRPGRQQLPVAEPVLVLRPSGGVHPGLAGLRDRVRDPPGVLPQTAVRLPRRGGGDGRA